EHQRHDGRAKPRARDRRWLTGRRRRAAEQDRREAGDREDQKDSHRQRQLARGQEPDRPAPLIQRREPHAEQRQRTPLFPRRNPREADVQQQEVREQRHGAVLAGREQHRRREAAEQAEHRDEDRVAPDGEQYRNRGDQREQRERDSCWNQVPERVGGEERREQDRDRGGVERVGRHPILARRAQVADEQKSDTGQHPDRDANRRRQPAVIDRVAEEEDS